MNSDQNKQNQCYNLKLEFLLEIVTDQPRPYNFSGLSRQTGLSRFGKPPLLLLIHLLEYIQALTKALGNIE